MEFSYSSSSKDFILLRFSSGDVSRFDQNHEWIGVELDFKTNLVYKNGKKVRSINFSAPTLSSWPKEQILILSNKIDSLNAVLNSERSISLAKISKLN
jgi:hypothetical protein